MTPARRRRWQESPHARLRAGNAGPRAGSCGIAGALLFAALAVIAGAGAGAHAAAAPPTSWRSRIAS
jgi:hypothetical protein